MVNFPPLMPSANWFYNFLQAYSKGLSQSESIESANKLLVSPRDFGRYTLYDFKGNTLILSVAVDGGGRQLRYFDKLSELDLSEHGHWRRNHLKALESCLGRRPYFPYLFPELENVYLNKNLQTLKDFNTALLNFLYNFILGNIKDSDIIRFYNNETLMQRGDEISSRIKPDMSSIEIVSTFGKESLLGFLALK